MSSEYVTLYELMDRAGLPKSIGAAKSIATMLRKNGISVTRQYSKYRRLVVACVSQDDANNAYSYIRRHLGVGDPLASPAVRKAYAQDDMKQELERCYRVIDRMAEELEDCKEQVRQMNELMKQRVAAPNERVKKALVVYGD